MAWLFALGGAQAGLAQAGLLFFAARRGPGPASALTRLLLVGALLLLAARSGHLLFGAVGWIVGFASTALVLQQRLR